jgi:ABC-type proline/glycine betaine transport system permease subunit
MPSEELKYTDYLKAWVCHVVVMTIFATILGAIIGVFVGIMVAMQGRPTTEVQNIVRQNVVLLQTVVGLIGLPVSFFTFKLFVEKFIIAKITNPTEQPTD